MQQRESRYKPPLRDVICSWLDLHIILIFLTVALFLIYGIGGMLKPRQEVLVERSPLVQAKIDKLYQRVKTEYVDLDKTGREELIGELWNELETDFEARSSIKD